ncbi:MAG TPA: nuclease-related domain-containing protein [Fimbriimonas sp.]|nr:nuclease-related domain-containing protein [Fimbriimonas sp.]
MQVERFPSYAKEKWQQPYQLARIFGGVAVGMFLINRVYTQGQTVTFFLGALFGVFALKSLMAGFGARIGDLGEDRIEEALENLSDQYILIRNWVPPSDSKKQGDVDFILLGPFGILVIEAKTYTVPAKCVGKRWWIKRSNGSWRPIKSVSQQLTKNVSAVSKAFGTNATGVVVFNDRATLTLEGPTVKVIRRKELHAFVLSLPNNGMTSKELWTKLNLGKTPEDLPSAA